MKRRGLLFLALALLAQTGCISTNLVKYKAQAHAEYSAEDQELKEVKGQPGYYALLPATILGDVLTSPIQAVYFLCTDDSHTATANLYNIPIPLP